MTFDAETPIPDDVPPPVFVPHKAPQLAKYAWKKGEGSANPGGRPKELREIQSLARISSVEMLETLIHLAKTAKMSSVRAQCAEAVLNRAFGKPVVPIKQEISVFDAMNLPDQERLAAAIRALNAGVEAAALNSPDPVPTLDLTPDESGDR